MNVPSESDAIRIVRNAAKGASVSVGALTDWVVAGLDFATNQPGIIQKGVEDEYNWLKEKGKGIATGEGCEVFGVSCKTWSYVAIAGVAAWFLGNVRSFIPAGALRGVPKKRQQRRRRRR
jgi:hypothetical protein